MLPSIYLAVHLVKQEVFASKASAFMKNELALSNAHVASSNIDAKRRLIELTLIGELIENDQVKELNKRLIHYDLGDASLILHQAKNQRIDVSALKSNIVSDLYKENLKALEEKNKLISEKEFKIRNLEAGLKVGEIRKAVWMDVSNELNTQYPEIEDIYFSEAVEWQKNKGKVADGLIIVNLNSTAPLTLESFDKIKAWLKVRIKNDNIKVIVEPKPVAPALTDDTDKDSTAKKPKTKPAKAK